MLNTDPNQPEFVDFYLPFNGHLKASNRWVKLADLVPWGEVERCYSGSFAGTGMGAPAKSGRIRLRCITDQKALRDHRRRNGGTDRGEPYLQYFLGLKELLKKPPFDPSMMVHLRSRFTQAHHELINSKIIAVATGTCAPGQETSTDENEEGNPPPNAGKLLVDATCTPADIKYPTDLGLLNEAREKTEALIDQFHGHSVR